LCTVPRPSEQTPATGVPIGWLLVDLVLVGCFAVAGRMSHYDEVTLLGWLDTAWPFLVSAVITWAVLWRRRRPVGNVGSGVVMWLGVLVGGLAMRYATGAGTALPFVVVATLVLLLVLVGPRLVVALLRRRR
jgi:hypothetical protein